MVYYALVPASSLGPDVTLCPVQALPALPFDHAQIAAAALDRLRSKGAYSSLPCFLLGERFTLPELQKTYEIILAEPLNKSEFRRKIFSMGFLEECPGELQYEGARRPAQYYRLQAAWRGRLNVRERGL